MGHTYNVKQLTDSKWDDAHWNALDMCEIWRCIHHSLYAECWYKCIFLFHTRRVQMCKIGKYICISIQHIMNDEYTFSALTLLVGRQEGHPASKNWVVGCWHGYLSKVRCRFAYGPADPIATHCLLLQEIQIGFGFIFLVAAHPVVV